MPITRKDQSHPVLKALNAMIPDWLVDPTDVVSVPIAPLTTSMAKKGVPKAVEMLNRLIEKGPDPKDPAMIFAGERLRGSPWVPEIPQITPTYMTTQGNHQSNFLRGITGQKGGGLGGKLEIPTAAGPRNRSPIQADLRTEQQHWKSTAGAPKPLQRPPQADRRLLGSTNHRNKAKRAILNEDDVRQIRSMYAAGMDYDTIHAQFPQVARSTVAGIAKETSFSGVK